MSIDELKAEQQQLSRELTAAQAIIDRHLAATNDLESSIDAAPSVLANAAQIYSQAPDAIQRQLLQELFEKVPIRDQKLVGADLTRPYHELLGIKAGEFVAAVGDGRSGQITYDRGETRVYLRAERPSGPLVVDKRTSDGTSRSEVQT